MNRYCNVKPILALVLFVSLFQVAVSHASGSYHVEAVVFSNNNGYQNYSDALPSNAPDFGKSWSLNTAYLNDYAKKLRNSGSYSVVRHTAWGVNSKPYSKSAAHTITGDGLNGWVKIFAKSLLFAHIDVIKNGSRINCACHAPSNSLVASG